MLNVLSSLEMLAGSATCQNATDEDIREVRRLHDQMLAFCKIRNRLQYFKLNQEIHFRLISLSGNESLSLVHVILQSRMKRIRFIGDQNDDTWSAAVTDHEEMMAVLEARDESGLSAAMVDHLERSGDRIKDAI